MAYLKWLPDEFSNIEKLKLNWIRNFIILLGLYYLVFIGFGIASLVSWYGYKIQFWQYCMLAITIYYISAAGYAYVNKLMVAFDLKKAVPENEAAIETINLTPIIEEKHPVAAGDTGTNQPVLMEEVKDIATDAVKVESIGSFVKYDSIAIKQLILSHLQNQKPYLDSDLTLSQLSNQLKKPAYVITQVIKNNLGLNFNDLINGYRVDAVIEKLKQGEYKEQTLLGIAYDCGFNSKATFNRAFKKAKNIAPSDFIEKL